MMFSSQFYRKILLIVQYVVQEGDSSKIMFYEISITRRFLKYSMPIYINRATESLNIQTFYQFSVKTGSPQPKEAQEGQIQLNNCHKLYKFFPLILNIIQFMNQASQGYHYFSLQTEPRLDFRNLGGYQRKLSCDDLICELVDQGKENMTEDQVCENIELNRSNTKDTSKGSKKGSRKTQNSRIIKDGKAIGHWQVEEHKRYHWFLEIHFNHFLNKHLRRMDRIFKSMEKFIATRAAEQCRSHHQKTEKKYGNFRNILRQLRRQSYGSEDVGGLIEDMQRNNVECPSELLNLDVQELGTPKTEVQQSQKSTIDEINENEGLLDPFHELNREYQPNISFLMF